MSDAAWALLGLAVGAAIPALTTIYQTQKQSDQADRDRQETREARLFELRRDAYVNFQKIARSTLDYFWRSDEVGDVPPPDEDALDPLLNAEAAVQMFGTAASAEKARAVVAGLGKYGSKHPYSAVDAEIRTFADSARKDLGARA